jgi:hypothetical protein
MSLLDSIEAPDYMFQDVLKWAKDAKDDGLNFQSRVTTRKSYVEDLSRMFHLEKMSPRITSAKLEHKYDPVPVVHYDFCSMLRSLLLDEKLMQPENLVINNVLAEAEGDEKFNSWFDLYSPTDMSKVGDVLSGSWYQSTKERYRSGVDFICPLIFYVDRTMIDPHHLHFNLEPVNFTLAIFERECRAQFQFWRTLGYMPGDEVGYDELKQKGAGQRNYHKVLRIVLQGVMEVHNNPYILQNHFIQIGKRVQKRNIHVPIAYIIADTQGADKLCGRFISYRSDLSRIHRTCYCDSSTASDLSIECHWVNSDDIVSTMEKGSEAERQKISMQHIPSFAFKELDPNQLLNQC